MTESVLTNCGKVSYATLSDYILDTFYGTPIEQLYSKEYTIYTYIDNEAFKISFQPTRKESGTLSVDVKIFQLLEFSGMWVNIDEILDFSFNFEAFKFKEKRLIFNRLVCFYNLWE